MRHLHDMFPQTKAVAVQKLVVDLSGSKPIERMVPLTDEEVADYHARSAAFEETAEREDRRRRKLADLAPDAVMIAKIETDEPLTDAERDRLARWLALRTVG